MSRRGRGRTRQGHGQAVQSRQVKRRLHAARHRVQHVAPRRRRQDDGGGQPGDAVLLGRLGGIIDVDPHGDIAGFDGPGDPRLAEDLGLHGPALPAPRRSKLDQHQAIGAGGHLLGGVNRRFPVERLLGLSDRSDGQEPDHRHGESMYFTHLVHSHSTRRASWPLSMLYRKGHALSPEKTAASRKSANRGGRAGQIARIHRVPRLCQPSGSWEGWGNRGTANTAVARTSTTLNRAARRPAGRSGQYRASPGPGPRIAPGRGRCS